MPLAALGGPAALMDLLAPLGPVYQAGTLSGNPVATPRYEYNQVMYRLDLSDPRLEVVRKTK